MDTIKFGTDGWRAIIAQEFTVNNVARVTKAVAAWTKENFDNPSVVVGFDCRFAGDLFSNTVAQVLTHEGVKVHLDKNFTSTPMVSMGVVEHNASLGVVITASHNPPAYNGYKLKGHYGGPLEEKDVKVIESGIPDEHGVDLTKVDLAAMEQKGLLNCVDLETMYVKKVEESFDLGAIRNSGLRFAYDAMYGAGQSAMRRLFPDMDLLHCEHNPTFKGQAPEPLHKNLQEFSEFIKKEGNIACGFATDGDADRIGMYDSSGNFVDSHHIILLLINYLVKEKGMTGKICTAFSTTQKVQRLCDHYGLELDVVKIGFKYIAGIMIREDVLLGGEESGGIAIKGHIPERDGIWMGLVMWEYMAKSGKSIEELIAEVYEVTGKFAFQRNDLHIPEELKQSIIAKCQDSSFSSFGSYEVQRVDDKDGWKYFFNDDSWLMIRPSGTEPVLRTYAEAPSLDEAARILDACKETLGA